MTASPRDPDGGTGADPLLAPVGPGGLILTEVCSPPVRSVLQADPSVMILGRASSPHGNQATDMAASSVGKAVKALERREGIRLPREQLPTLPQLKAHHRTAGTSEETPVLGGGTMTLRWSVWSAPQLGVLIVMITGSGTKIGDEHFEQPAVTRVAELVRTYRPAVVYAWSLLRVGRANLSPLIAVLQALGTTRTSGPLVGDADISLTEADMALEMRLAMLGILGKYQALALVRDNRAGMRARTGTPHETLPGVWWFGTGQPPPPGLTKLRLRTYDNAMPRTAVVLDCPAARPPEHLIAGGRPAARTPDGELADQVALVRWLGERLFTDGYGARECAAYLAAHGWAPPAVRWRRKVETLRTVVDGQPVERIVEPPAVQLHAGYAGRSDGRRALQAFLNHLDFYVSGVLTVKLPGEPDPVPIPGVLPLDGRPWITVPQARRIRDAQARQHSGPHNKHLWAGLPVLVDGQPAVLAPRIRRSDEQLVYYFHQPAEHGRAVHRSRAAALPPLPAAVLAEWYAEALSALALPVSLRLVDRPTVGEEWRTRAGILQSEIDQLDLVQAKREDELDPGTRTDGRPDTLEFLKKRYAATYDVLCAKRAELEYARVQEELHRGSPALAGAPLGRLVGLAAALTKPYDEGHRLLLRDLTETLTVTTTRRTGTGRRPAYDLDAVLTLQLHDDTDTWRATSRHRWTGGAVRRTPGRLAAAIDGLYAGTPLRETLGTDWPAWLPAIRTALGCPGKFAFAYARDARLLRLGMAVIYPRRPDVRLRDDPNDPVRLAGPPVNLEDLPRLGRRLHEPVALLRAIHAAYTVTDLPRWIRNASPAVAAAYAAAADHGGQLPHRDLPPVLRPGRTIRAGTHRLAVEWTDAGDGLAALRRCRCGSVRRAVVLLREVTGSLCLDCRTDRAGVPWDASYDRFLDAPPRAD